MIKKSKPEYEIVPVFQTRPAGQSAYDKFVKKLSKPLTKKQKENIHRIWENVGILDLRLDFKREKIGKGKSQENN